MKKTIILLILFLGKILSAQNFEVVVGKKLEKSKTGAVLDKMISNTSDGYWFYTKKLKYVLFDHKEYEEHLEIYDKDFSYNSKIDLSSKKDKIIVEQAININNLPVLLIREENKVEGYVDFDFSIFNKTGSIEKKVGIGRFKFKTNKDIPTILTSHSPDSSLWVSTFFIDHDDKKDILKIYVSVVDKNLNEVWSKIVDMQNAQRMINIEQVSINNDGEVLILYSESTGKKPIYKIDGKPGYQVKIAIINQTTLGNEMFKSTLDLDECFSKFYYVKPMSNGNFSVHALISKNDQYYANGYARHIYSKGNYELKSKIFRYFSEKEIEQFKKENLYISKGKQEGLNQFYKFVDVSFSNNGNSYITLENSFFYKRLLDPFSKTNYSPTITTHHNYSYIILQANESGSNMNVETLPASIGLYDGGICNSAAVNMINDKYFIIYNDHKKNPLTYKETKIKTAFFFADLAPIIAWFDEKEGWKRQHLFDNEKIGGSVVISSISKVNENQLVFTLFEPQTMKDPFVNMGLITIR